MSTLRTLGFLLAVSVCAAAGRPPSSLGLRIEPPSSARGNFESTKQNTSQRLAGKGANGSLEVWLSLEQAKRKRWINQEGEGAGETRTLREIRRSTEKEEWQVTQERWVDSIVSHCDLPCYPKRVFIMKRVNVLQGAEDPTASSSLGFT